MREERKERKERRDEMRLGRAELPLVDGQSCDDRPTDHTAAGGTPSVKTPSIQQEMDASCREVGLAGADKRSFELSTCISSGGTYESANKYVSAIYRHLQIAIADELAEYKIGSGQYIFLLTIAEREGITQKVLSEELLIDKTTTAKAISKLEAEGYVKRIASPEDQRCNQLYLTEDGYKVVPKVKERLRKLMSIGRQGISDEEYNLLIDLLKRVLTNVHAMVMNRGGA